ncbi:MAG: ABC transporter substrate-binding protein [Candidatus Competibacteraceae bacterium]|nr:ABC transporter substrate-binding protein [Candidatus Competibacteraceae bacterium]MCB1813409.1 ABC transporter substrate-binding protein [Candidatus Competibacteraceae bacterium]
MPNHVTTAHPARPGSQRCPRHFFGAAAALVMALHSLSTIGQEVGVSPDSIKLGSVLVLEGDASGLGQGMKLGLEAALKGHTVQNRSIEVTYLNDFYDPKTTVQQTQKLIDEGIFAMIGNVGTPTARVALPLLAKNAVPAVGFFTGAGLLRPGEGNVINYRASYVQEVSAVIGAALQAGLAPAEICAYVQNDAYGMAGIAGVINAFDGIAEAQDIITTLTELMQMEGEHPERNYMGPVGVYQRNTMIARDGHDSLKVWEEISNYSCRLVVTVGAYTPIAQFVGYARSKGDNWITSAVSFTGAFNLRDALAENNIQDGVIMTQVVPPLDSQLPIIQKAQAELQDNLSYVSLEGYIVGRMFLHLMNNINGALTRQNFLNTVQGKRYVLDGLNLDFTDDNQASDLVTLTLLSGSHYQVIDPNQLKQIFTQ